MKNLTENGGDIFRYTLSISLSNIGRFLVCIVTDLSCSNSFSEMKICPRVIDASTSYVSH